MAHPRHATRRRSKGKSVKGKSSKARALLTLPARHALTGNGISHRAASLLGKLTRIHLIVLSAAMCSIVLGVSAPFGGDANATARERDTVALQIPRAEAAAAEAVAIAPQALHDEPVIEDEKPILAALAPPRLERLEVKRGDTISNLFASADLGAGVLHRVMQAGSHGKSLTRMFPGEVFEFEFDHLGDLSRISRVKSPLETIHFIPDGEQFLAERELREPEVRQVHRSGIVEHSLSQAAEKAGLSASTTMNMANIFGGVMDFALDVRSGDRFTLVYEELYLDGDKLRDGTIVAAQYVNAGTAYNAFRYEHGNGEIGYYNEHGESMRKVFLRAPLDFTRVSSSFNLRRLHPITKKVKPHRGIDYAARTGTPVFSVGDGRVVTSGYSKANGKYVVIRHGEAYTTKYLHLHRRSVNRGQRVKQGQIIGQVGCTGLCTGPHLHYEFLVNGVHRNPRTIISKLPKAKKLAKTEMLAFNSETDSAREILQHFSQQFELAALSEAE